MLEQRHMDLAASIQKVTEEIMLRMAREVHRQTRMKNLVLAGGVALNCVANGRLLREGPFENIWIQPAAGDAGGALGAAVFVWYHLLDKPRQTNGHDHQKGSLLGPRYSNEQIAAFPGGDGGAAPAVTRRGELLRVRGADDGRRQDRRAGFRAGWSLGRGRWERAASSATRAMPRMQATMNLKIKFRESFRPFAPCVLQERVSDYFAMRPDQESPYMLLVAPVLEKHRVALSETDRQTMAAAPDLRQRVNVVRSSCAGHHARGLQRARADRGRKAARALLSPDEAFEQLTGCPVIVNTSFNVRGEPIVCTPQEAYRCFLATDMDALVLEDFVLRKEQMNQAVTAAEREKYLAQFEPD